MTSIGDLHDLAYRLGITLGHHHGGPKAWYSASTRRISTRWWLPVWEYKSSLAHELGHAIHGDQRLDHGHFSQMQERRADRFAAELLIDPDQLADLALWHVDDLDCLAADLEVTPHLLAVYLHHNPQPRQEEAA
ncbi:ImmA/IrrE family metallo-endopeptidase [Corynebacterium heidelbergense]|uniref:ImmA/IrrE family metallo-endopeptidase n=1 Tax=Corynebacterium heidelbergense TaxID=2055947 RepID=A0A364VDN4_9CORY|nr:ImmA/IrrE family metallo-endopeptidase [Corynebacterium heidelbergense]RAV34750.1 ImmA/IrrE family metallo-endopeptidase [Corynebacterium heidelbergense]WCZ37010.1 hypothetical protein CHEID_07385 [Corynebacterium heidelbergense]